MSEMVSRIFTSIMSGSSAKGSRSGALQPLIYAMGTVIAGVGACRLSGCPEWVMVLLACLLALVVGMLLLGFGYLLVRDRDALRSEQFALSKLAIERGLIGDSATGLLDPGMSSKKLIIEAKQEEGVRQ